MFGNATKIFLDEQNITETKAVQLQVKKNKQILNILSVQVNFHSL
jgi:hypothetical protein